MKKKTTKNKQVLPILTATNSPEWEAIFGAMEDGVCVQSLDACILKANRAFATMVGLPIEEIIGRNSTELFGCREQTEQSIFCARIKNCKTHRCENELISGKWSKPHFRTRSSPVYSDKGEVIAYVMVVRDITHQLHQEYEIARAQQLALIGELAASLAHEIKNPLAGIQGAIDILLQHSLINELEHNILSNIRDEVNRIDSSVEALLACIHPRPMKRTLCSLADVLQQVVVIARNQLACSTVKANLISIEYQPPNTPIMAIIDAAQIEDAILNLIINAIEAIENSGYIKIALSLENHSAYHNYAVITITDNGSGIPKEQLKQIFSPFFTSKQHGTGLGLAAVQRIMRIHNGTIEVSSKVGTGSTFKLRLPLHQDS